MRSKTQRDLLIICNHEGNPYFEELKQKTGFDRDSRIKFAGTVYDQNLLKYIRNHAFVYIQFDTFLKYFSDDLSDWFSDADTIKNIVDWL